MNMDIYDYELTYGWTEKMGKYRAISGTVIVDMI